MTRNNDKPGRPFGVTLAILLSVVVFSLLPLSYVAIIVAVRDVISEVPEEPVPIQGEEVEAIASGGDFTGGISDAQIVIQIVLSGGFLVIAFFAWLGRPAFMRYVFIAGVLLLAVAIIASYVLPVFEPDEAGASGGSLDSLWSAMQNGHVLLILFVSLYVVWYLNRGPARAFYRGYYLADNESAGSQAAEPAQREAS